MNIRIVVEPSMVWAFLYHDGSYQFEPEDYRDALPNDATDDEAIEVLLYYLKHHLYNRYTSLNHTFEHFTAIHQSIFIIRDRIHPEKSWANNSGRRAPLDTVTREIVYEGIASIDQSDGDINLFDLQFGFSLPPIPSLPPITNVWGYGKCKVPPWIGARYKLTWMEQKLNNQSINCGAFAIAYQLVARPSRGQTTIRKAKELMTTFGWGAGVTILELGKFVQVYTDYRLTVVTTALQYLNTTFTGIPF